jgi:cellulose synthase/poly-beta-1,6-N-acetylglucosamine synthase-like glycosyltransferase
MQRLSKETQIRARKFHMALGPAGEAARVEACLDFISGSRILDKKCPCVSLNRLTDILKMKYLIEFISLFSVAIVVLFALSQAGLAVYYRRSKTAKTTGPTKHDWQGPLPTILLQLPIYNEQYVVERLLEQIAKIDYPRDLLTIQLLDDSTDETSTIAAATIARLAKAGVKIHHVRRINRRGYKAGAMEAGLKLDHSDFVTIFDADFLPRPDFLKKIIGYFSDPKVGMVQTRWEHLNENFSLLTKLLSFAIDAHFSVEQGGRQAADGFINFNGTAGMWRRKTIEEAGGWQDDCLTEDLDLSFRAQLKGWQFLFVEDIGTPSELPAHMSAIRTQQFRWTKGAAETGRKTLAQLWSSPYPFLTKLLGSFHMLNTLVFPFIFLLSLCLLVYPFVFGPETLAYFWPINLMMGLSFFSVMFMYWIAHYYGQFQASQKSSAQILERAFLFIVMVNGLCIHNGLAVLQGLMGRATPFVRTPKINIVKPGDKLPQRTLYNGIRFPLLNFAEMTFCALFAGLILYCLKMGFYAMIPSAAFFAAAYGMVTFFTIQEFRAGLAVQKN